MSKRTRLGDFTSSQATVSTYVSNVATKEDGDCKVFNYSFACPPFTKIKQTKLDKLASKNHVDKHLVDVFTSTGLASSFLSAAGSANYVAFGELTTADLNTFHDQVSLGFPQIDATTYQNTKQKCSHFKTYTRSSTFFNPGNTCVHIQLSQVVARADNFAGVQSSIDDLSNEVAGGVLANSFASIGYRQDTYSPTLFANHPIIRTDDVDYHWSQNHTFTQNFKVKNTRVFVLPAGGKFKINIVHHLNQNFNEAANTEFNGVQQFKGWSSLLMRIQGELTLGGGVNTDTVAPVHAATSGMPFYTRAKLTAYNTTASFMQSVSTFGKPLYDSSAAGHHFQDDTDVAAANDPII